MGPGGAFGNPRLNLEFSPETRVTLTRPFWLGRTEVTQAQWQAVMGTSIQQQWEMPNGSSTAGSPPRGSKRELDGVGPDHPMYCVTWEEAMEFCAGDECVEVGPDAIRVRKVLLTANERAKARSKSKSREQQSVN